MEEFVLFVKALQEAVKAEKKAFVCPICGGTVKWPGHPETAISTQAVTAVVPWLRNRRAEDGNE